MTGNIMAEKVSGTDILSPKMLSLAVSPRQKQTIRTHLENDVTAEEFTRGRTYNIRIDDQILLKFSPNNSDSIYYFGDPVGGTLNFFHEGPRRCLEVYISLETCEVMNQNNAHTSRKSSLPTIKVHSDQQEIVADLVCWSFLFSVPMEGPASHSSLNWSLRFEFFTSNNMDSAKLEHPLLVKEREKSEWVLPIFVSAPSQNPRSPPTFN